tara:strand:+ start:89 stop:946 length:858 start_codon:yes stop_codon:yes gene_type:complete
MKIALCFWGITRSLKYTIDSIKHHILNPLNDADIEYVIFVHTFKFQSEYNNPRAKEFNVKLDFDEHTLLNPDFLQIDDQDEFKFQHSIEKYRFLPDPWESEYVCMDNFICAMYSKKQLGIMVKQSNISFDYVMYLRPDVRFYTSIDKRYFNLTNEYNICTPNFHLFPKLNDRFCIITASNLEQYSLMFNDMYEYSRVFPLHSERFQHYVMTRMFQWKIRYIPVHFNRVRADGRESNDVKQYYKSIRCSIPESIPVNMNTKSAKPKKKTFKQKYNNIQPIFKKKDK